jgi:hypothetical protein
LNNSTHEEENRKIDKYYTVSYVRLIENDKNRKDEQQTLDDPVEGISRINDTMVDDQE